MSRRWAGGGSVLARPFIPSRRRRRTTRLRLGHSLEALVRQTPIGGLSTLDSHLKSVFQRLIPCLVQR